MGHNRLVWCVQDKRVAGQGRGVTVQGFQDEHHHPSLKVQDQNLAFALCPWWQNIVESAADLLKKGLHLILAGDGQSTGSQLILLSKAGTSLATRLAIVFWLFIQVQPSCGLGSSWFNSTLFASVAEIQPSPELPSRLCWDFLKIVWQKLQSYLLQVLVRSGCKMKSLTNWWIYV